MSIQPYPLYFDSVAKELQKPPFSWVGKAGYDMATKFKDIINKHHSEDSTPPDCAKDINDTYMKQTANKKWSPVDFTKSSICKRRLI